MGFINTEYTDTISNLVTGFKEKINNPYWSMNDKKPTIVTYYKLNHEKSMLDKATGLEYSRLGDGAPLRFNKIENFILYEVGQFTVNLQDGDYGLESDPIEGEAILLPNTIEPTPGDYFAINYLKERLLFRVNSVNFDTLDTGANLWQIAFKLDQTDSQRIDDQIVESYKMITDNIGTNFKSIIKSTDYNLIEKLEMFEESLKEYYFNLFFEDRVETFIFYLAESRMYDPYMIEFILRNKILSRERNKYTHIRHQIDLERTFAIDYDSSLFRAFELKNKEIIDRNFSLASLIEEPNSIFSFRPEKYYRIKYIRKSYKDLEAEVITNLNPVLLKAIVDNKLFGPDDELNRYNIIVKYFNKQEYNDLDIKAIEDILFQNNIEIFYLIPFYIYIIQDYIKRLLVNI